MAEFARESEVFLFDSSQKFRLTERFVSASVDETKDFNHFNYHFQAKSAELDSGALVAHAVRHARSARDEALADIAALRKHAREQLETGTTITVYDMTDVDSDNSPPEELISTRPPSAKTKQALWDEVEKQIAAQEAMIRENFREIHAAVQQALPLGTVLDELSPPQSAAEEVAAQSAQPFVESSLPASLRAC